MERSEAIQWTFIMGVYAWMMMSDVVFSGNVQVASASKIVSWSLMLASLFVIEWWCTVAASRFFAIQAIDSQTEKSQYWFVNLSGVTHKQHPRNPNWAISELPLGKKVTIEDVGPVKTVWLQHEYDFERRIKTGSGKVNFMGNNVDHHGKATLIVDKGPVTVDHGEPIPTFILRCAPRGDRRIQQVPSLTNTPILTTNPTSNPGMQNLLQAYKTLKAKHDKVCADLTEQTAKATYYHTKYVQVEGAYKTQGEETNALLKNSPLMRNAVIDYVQNWVMARGDIRSLTKSMTWYTRIPKTVYYLIGVIALSALVLSKPEITTGLGDFFSQGGNQLWLLLLAGIIVAALYYLVRLRRKS